MIPRPPRFPLFPYTTLFRSPVPPSHTRVYSESGTSTAAPTTGPHSVPTPPRSEEHTSELQSHSDLVCRLLLEKKNDTTTRNHALTQVRSRPYVEPSGITPQT